MNVKEILKQVSYVSSGLDNPTEQDYKIYLGHLNLIHLELYRLTAVYNQAIPTFKQETVIKENGFLDDPIDYYLMTCVYNVDNSSMLSNVLLSDIVSAEPMLSSVGQPTVWCNYNNHIMAYPKPIKETKVLAWYRPEPAHLELGSAEKDIPYPKCYHQVLVDGTAYYVFQSETGMKNSTEMALANSRWEKGKLELISYLQNTAPIRHQSTYGGNV